MRNKNLIPLLLGSALLALGAVPAVHSQIVTGSQDFSITVEQTNLPSGFTLAGMSVYAGAEAISDPVVLTGFTGPLPITVSGTGSPSYSLDGGVTFTSEPGEVNPGDSLIVRVAASPTAGQTRTGTVTIGGQTTEFVVTSAAHPSSTILNTSNTFINAPLSTTYTTSSTHRFVSVALNDTPLTVSGGMEYQLNGAAWTTNPTLLPAGTHQLFVRLTSADTYETTRVGTLTVGPMVRTMTITTIFNQVDFAPSAFNLTDVIAAPNAPTQTSVTVSGLGTGKEPFLRVSGSTAGRGAVFSVNGDAFSTTQRRVKNGDLLTFRINASPYNGAVAQLVAETLDPVGAVASTNRWNVTTSDPQAVDAFSFNWTNAEAPATRTSRTTNQVTLSGGSGFQKALLVNASGYLSGRDCYGAMLNGDQTMPLITSYQENEGPRLVAPTAVRTNGTSISGNVWSCHLEIVDIGVSPGDTIAVWSYPGGGILRNQINDLYSALCIGSVCAEVRHNWYDVGSPTDPRAADPFLIAARAEVQMGATGVASEPFTVSWAPQNPGFIPPNIPISISGAGNPQYRINGGDWTTGTGWVSAGSTIEVRLDAASTPVTARTATLSVGTTTAPYTVTTEHDTVADAFTLVAVTSATPETLVTSAPVTITGISTSVPVSVSGDGNPELSTNNGVSWAQSGTVAPNGTVRVRMTAPAAFDAARVATLDVNGVTAPFSVTTQAFNFAIVAKTQAARNVLVVSDPVLLPAYAPTAAISVSGEGAPEYSLDGGAFTSAAGTVSGGQTLRVRLTTSSEKGVARVASVTIGAATAGFSVETAPPDACETGPIGSVCSDGAVYAGIVNGNKIFAAPSSNTNVMLKSTASVTMGSISNDGLVNHHATTLAGIGSHPAAAACAARGDEWVVPSSTELTTMYTYRSSAPAGTYILSGSTGSRYWSSTEFSTDPRRGTYRIFDGGTIGDASKNTAYQVHCIRYSREEPRVYEDPCASGAPSIGTMCADGAVYAGAIDGKDVYFESTASANNVAYKTTQTFTTGTNTTSDAVQARLAMEFAGLAQFPGQQVCASKGVSAYGSAWYLPTRRDLQHLITYRTQGVLRQMTDANTRGATEVPQYIMAATQESDLRYAEYLDKGTAGVPAFGTSTTYRTKSSANKAVLCVRFDAPQTYEDPCAGTPSAGAFCADGTVFAGSGLYLPNTGTHTARVALRTTTTALAGTTSTSDGVANTNAMITAGNHPAAQVCRDLGPDWHLPAQDELTVLRSAITQGEVPGMYGTSTSTTALGARYWSSTQGGTTSTNWTRTIATTTSEARTKTELNSVICVRKR